MNIQNEPFRLAALEYTGKGFSVIPVGKDKKPLLSTWKEFQKRIATSEEIETWCKTYRDMQIGIVTGKVSGITVIDIEANGYWDDLTDTIKSVTGRGGRHFFYDYQEGIKNGVALWPLTDVRNDGGFVVVPPSENLHGGYTWVNQLDRDKLAHFPNDLFNQKVKRWNGLCRSYIGVPEGHRHDAMVSRAGTLLRRIPDGFWKTEAWVQFQQDNRNNQPPLEDKELHSIFESIGTRELARLEKEDIPIAISPETPLPSVPVSHKLIVHSCAELLLTPHTPDAFLINPLVPKGMVSALTSQAGAGKSILALEMAKSVASGQPFLGQFKTEQTSVLLLDQEMSPNTIVGRFQSLIDDPSLPIFTVFESFLKITKPEDYKKVVDVINEHSIGFVVLDTLVTFHNGDENAVNEMRAVMEAMMQLCKDTKVTVLFLHHQRKGSYGEQVSQASMRGSTEIAAKIGSQITLESRDKDKEQDDATGDVTRILTLEQHKSRLPDGFDKFYVRSIYNKKTRKSQLLYGGEFESKKAKKDVQKDKINELFSKHLGKPLTRQKIIGEIGSQKNTDEALAEMAADGYLKKERLPGGKTDVYSPKTLEIDDIAVDY